MPSNLANPDVAHRQKASVAASGANSGSEVEDGTIPSCELASESKGSTTKGVLTTGKMTKHQGEHPESELVIENSGKAPYIAEKDVEKEEAKIPGESGSDLNGEALDREQDGISTSVKPTTKRITKRKKGRSGKRSARVKTHPGFGAFAKQGDEGSEKGSEKEAIATYKGLNEAVEPEFGIHSRAWASAVEPQTSQFLRMPLDIRTMIFGYIFASFKEFKSIEPHKRGNTYWDPTWLNASDETNAMNLICKSIYLDVNTWGWLYRFKTFHFPGHGLLRQFLWAIKPSHKNAIRSVALELRLMKKSKSLNKTAFLALAELKNLTHLALKIVFDWPVMTRNVYTTFAGPFISLPDEYFEMVRQCKGLNDLKGLMSFSLEMEIDSSFEMEVGFSFSSRSSKLDPSSEDKWANLEKDLQKVLIQNYHGEVRESNAKLRGSVASDLPTEDDE